jgi:hypothetical protein
MMCFDELPLESRSLTGDYFSNDFNYLQVSLYPCVSVKKGDCASDKEVLAFYADNPKLQFMFVDKYFDINQYDALFSSYINKVNYVSIDPAYTSAVSFFVRKMYIEG